MHLQALGANGTDVPVAVSVVHVSMCLCLYVSVYVATQCQSGCDALCSCELLHCQSQRHACLQDGDHRLSRPKDLRLMNDYVSELAGLLADQDGPVLER